MARYMITLNANPMGKEGLVVVTNEKGIQISPVNTSVRESRAKRHARRFVKDGERNVMLWRVDGAHPVPIRYREQKAQTWDSRIRGCNSTPIEMGLPEHVLKDAPGTRSKAGKLDFIRKRNRTVAIAMEANRA